MASKRYERTPEQIKLSEERKAKKQKLQPAATELDDEGRFLARPWITLPGVFEDDESFRRVKIMTWNVRHHLRPSYSMFSS